MIAAIVLAAGLSTRMGRPKMLLPWKSTTVIGQVVATLARAGLDEIVVVTGAQREAVDAAAKRESIDFMRTVFNPHYAEDDMLVSLQVGIAALDDRVKAMLVALGDQPQIEVEVVQDLVAAYRNEGHALIVPSYQMRRGHPWVVDRSLWPALLNAPPGSTMRDFLRAHCQQIVYLPVQSACILMDLDTPQDYTRDTQA